MGEGGGVGVRSFAGNTQRRSGSKHQCRGSAPPVHGICIHLSLEIQPTCADEISNKQTKQMEKVRQHTIQMQAIWVQIVSI